MMNKASANSQRDDFLIVGPKISRGSNVLEAVHALYYLPENYKLIFTGAVPKDQELYNEVVSLVERDALSERVQFSIGSRPMPRSKAGAVIVAPASKAVQKERYVSGESPEALASAILHVARSYA